MCTAARQIQTRHPRPCSRAIERGTPSVSRLTVEPAPRARKEARKFPWRRYHTPLSLTLDFQAAALEKNESPVFALFDLRSIVSAAVTDGGRVYQT